VRFSRRFITLYIFMGMILSIAANSYVKSTGTIDYMFYKKTIWIFSANFCKLGRQNVSNDWLGSCLNIQDIVIGYGLETIIIQ
jgi:NTE family protein